MEIAEKLVELYSKIHPLNENVENVENVENDLRDLLDYNKTLYDFANRFGWKRISDWAELQKIDLSKINEKDTIPDLTAKIKSFEKEFALLTMMEKKRYPGFQGGNNKFKKKN